MFVKIVEIKVRLKVGLELLKTHGGYLITTLINSSLPIILLPILTRYLEPEEYANVALFNLYLALSNTLSGTTLPSVVSKYFFDHSKEYISAVIGNSIRVSFCFSAITVLLILLLHAFTDGIIDLPLVWMLMIPLCSFFYVIISLALTIHRNQRKVLLFSYYKISNTIINIVTSIILVVIMLWGWQGRAIGILFSYFITSIMCFYYLRTNKYINFSFSRDVISRILSIVLPLISNAFLSVFISKVGFFFIQLYFAKSYLGIFSVGYQISEMIHLLFMTLSFSWNPFVYEEISKAAKCKKEKLAKGYILIALILLFGLIFLLLFSSFILRILTTSEYFEAKQFIPWLATGTFFYGLSVFLIPILIKQDKQNEIGLISFLSMVLMVILNNIFIRFFGVIGVAYAYCTNYLFFFILVYWRSQKTFSLPWFSTILNYVKT